MGAPKTKEEWWSAVDEHWPELKNILYKFLPMDGKEIIDPILNEVVLSEKTMQEVVEKAKEERQEVLARYFFAAWDAAPDNSEICFIPAWDVLCNLSSEDYLLKELV